MRTAARPRPRPRDREQPSSWRIARTHALSSSTVGASGGAGESARLRSPKCRAPFPQVPQRLSVRRGRPPVRRPLGAAATRRLRSTPSPVPDMRRRDPPRRRCAPQERLPPRRPAGLSWSPSRDSSCARSVRQAIDAFNAWPASRSLSEHNSSASASRSSARHARPSSAAVSAVSASSPIRRKPL